MSDKHSKTEEPTPKKLQDARKKGQVAKSADLNAGISLLIFAVLGSFLGEYIFKNLFIYFKNNLDLNFRIQMTEPFLRNLAFKNIYFFIILILPIAAIAMISGVIGNLIQTGFMFISEPLKPDFKKLNPIDGFKNIFSKKSMMTLLKNLLKLIIVFYLTYSNLKDNINYIFNSGNIGLEKLFFFFLELLKILTFNIVVVIFVVGILDFVIEKWSFKKNMMMTKDELKEEYKQMEGNPEIKQMRRQRQRELAMSRMMSDVVESTVIVTNPTHIAVAIRYDREKDISPKLVAKGAEFIAEKIKNKAKEFDIPIIENKPVARTIYKDVEIGENIPEDLYQVMAEILVIVYEMEELKKRKKNYR